MRERSLALFIIAAAAAYLAIGFAYGSSPDEEEYRISIVSTLIHARALVEGTYPLWTSELGLGLPHPLGQNFVVHPLAPLLAWMRADTWVMLFYGVQLTVLVLGGVALARAIGLSWLSTAVVVVTLILAAPSQNYILTDCWPSGFSGWSFVPGLMALLVKLTESTERADRRRFAVAAGVVGGLAFASGHPGYMLVYALPIAAFLAVHARVILRDLSSWAVCAGIAAVIALPTFLHVTLEGLRFPSGLPRLNYEDPLRTRHLWDVFVRPLPIGLPAGEDVVTTIVRRGARVASAGPPVAVLACLGAIVLPFTRRVRHDVLAGFLVSVVLITTPGLSAVKVFPATSLFRDPLVLCGVLLAAQMLDLLRARIGTFAVAIVAAVQIAAVGIGAWPFLARTLEPPRLPRTAASVFVDGGPITSVLEAQVSRHPGRIYLSNAVYTRATNGGLFVDGLWRNSGAFRRLRIVNGVFKGVSVDELGPSLSLPYGHLGAEPATQRSDALLALLGLRYVLAEEGEHVAAGLRPIRTLPVAAGPRLVLYEHESAAGGHFFTATDVSATLPRLPECTHQGLLCADVSEIWARRLPGSATVQARAGGLDVSVPPDSPDRLLVIAEMHRPGWTATVDGRSVPVSRAFGALIAVSVPPNAAHVTLVYRPLVLRTLTWLSLATMLGAVIFLAAQRRFRV